MFVVLTDITVVNLICSFFFSDVRFAKDYIQITIYKLRYFVVIESQRCCIA